MQILWSFIIFLFSSSYVLLLDHFAYSSRSLQKSLVLPILLLLFIIYRFSMKSWKESLQHQGRWFLLLWGSLVIQTLVIATGGFQSPFLILIHLFMVGMSFLFSFTISLIFLLFSFLVLFIDVAFNHDFVAYLTANPSIFLLQIVSLFSIIPIAYIISQQYHLKDMLSVALREKVSTDEAILESLNELIIVTDANFMILSINDAVEQVVQKPRSEILNTNLFNSLLLKDNQGKLASFETFFDKKGQLKHRVKEQNTFTIVNASKATKKVFVHIQTSNNISTGNKQFSFILSYAQELLEREAVPITIEKARAKYEAQVQALKQILQSSQKDAAYNPLLLIEKIENDLYNTQALTLLPYTKVLTKIDIAMLCQRLVTLEQDFAKSFLVKIQFAIEDFSHKDIKHLTVKRFPIEPENLTGPFFTIPCDVKYCEMVIRKLLDLSIFLASSTPDASIDVSIKQDKKNIVIQIQVPNPHIKTTNITDLFIPNYGKLATQTNVLAGSGLEGYLIRILTEKMKTPITTKVDAENIQFIWKMKKPEEA